MNNKKIFYIGVIIASVSASTLIFSNIINKNNQNTNQNTLNTNKKDDTKKTISFDFKDKTADDMREYYTDEGQEFLKKILPDSTSSNLALLNVGKTLDKELKDLKFTTIDNTEIQLKDLKGSKILLDFALKDCSICQSELDFLSNYNFRKEGIIYLHIFPRDTTAQIKSLFKEIGAKFKESNIVSSTGSNGFEFEDLSITNVPAKLFIDEKGTVQYAFVGAINDKETLELSLDRAFNENKPKLLDFLKK